MLWLVSSTILVPNSKITIGKYFAESTLSFEKSYVISTPFQINFLVETRVWVLCLVLCCWYIWLVTPSHSYWSVLDISCLSICIISISVNTINSLSSALIPPWTFPYSATNSTHTFQITIFFLCRFGLYRVES